MLTVGETRKVLGVSSRTLRWYTQTGKLTDHRTPTGKRRVFDADEVARVAGGSERAAKIAVVYGRVSTSEQKTDGDLDRQIAESTDAARAAGWAEVVVFNDVASGLNDRRRGLHRMLARIRQGGVGAVYVTHADRLTRYGLAVIESYLDAFGAELIVVRSGEELGEGAEAEIVRAVMEVLTPIIGRYHGARSQAKRRAARQAAELAARAVCEP